MSKLDLTGKTVLHKAYGEGKVLSHEHLKDAEDTLSIVFSGVTKEFKYPSAFEKFLIAADAQAGAAIAEELQALRDRKQQEKDAQVQRWEAMIRPVFRTPEREERESYPETEKISIEKTGVRKNVAFKCNFSDGGKNDERIGFCGVCSDGVIWNNIEVEKRTWCTQQVCGCMKYYQREMNRKELEESAENVFLCYESRMLREWKALAGMYANGEKKGQAMKLLHAEEGKLAVLTTRYPGEEERDRVIFAVFLVDEVYPGNNQDEGYVAAGAEYRLSLNARECRKILFWNYFANEKDAARPSWGSGLFRYLSDTEAVQILKDIAEVKKDSKDAAQAKGLLEHYCDLHGIDPDAVEAPSGALRL